MSLDPSPLSPAPTPLLSPTDPVPSRGSALIGTLIAVVLAVVVVFVSTRFGNALLFTPEGLKAGAQGIAATSPFKIQGFGDYWLRQYQIGAAPSYDSANNGNVFQSEAGQYHMNTVVITVTVDQIGDNSTTILGAGAAGNVDTYPDQVYENVAQQAIKAGLTPILKLEIRVLKGLQSDPWPGKIGGQWNGVSSTSPGIGGNVGAQEHAWFDSYTAQAVHYAQLSQQLRLPFYIFGSNIKQMTGDTADTKAGKDPAAKPGPGDSGACLGRRDCEWRHVLDALRGAQYTTYSGHATPGGGYAGKLIYAATSRDDDGAGFEWENITWWNAVDIIGVDAFFSLTQGRALDNATLMRAWRGLGSTVTPGNGDLFAQLRATSLAAGRPILFTNAGYESVPSSNSNPGRAPINSETVADQGEQLHDMQALLFTFDGQPWWVGVVWYGEYPVWPRSSLAQYSLANDPNISTNDWNFNSAWAGDCLATETCAHPEKAAGQWLRSYYTNQPIPANP